MHPRLSVSTIGFGPCPVTDVLAPLEAHGITRVGVPIAQLETGGTARNVATLRGSGFDVVDVVEPSAFTLDDPSVWPAEQDRLRTCVDLAAEVRAPTLYVTTGSAGQLEWDEAARNFQDAIAPVLDHARAAGVTLAVENTTTMRADLGFVHGLADTVEAADRAGVAVCADLFAAWTDRDLHEAITAGASRFALVQVADFVLGTVQTPDRAVPGDGDIPIARHLGWLADAGYGGPVELELLGPRITAEGPAVAVARAVTLVSDWL
jgi:sugar phosphate isomerase/epimerase